MMPLLNHHPLLIHEILLEIFYALALQKEPESMFNDFRAKAVSRENLLSAALVCKAFVDPATEVLWDVHFNNEGGDLVDFFERTLPAFTLSPESPTLQPGQEADEALSYVSILHIHLALQIS